MNNNIHMAADSVDVDQFDDVERLLPLNGVCVNNGGWFAVATV